MAQRRGTDSSGAAGVVQIGRTEPVSLGISLTEFPMTKPHRTLKKANHGSRPANSKARRLKRKHIRT
ncbi:MAG: hypothetical protein DWI25_09015 [Planctomycetota bacterium]|nr:MAG: hypothetical protein DWI25_09015 [Planctomycetota bacterium]